MRKIVQFAAFSLGILLLPRTLCADLKISLRLDPVSAIEFETVTAYVSVLNDGEQTFVLDEDDKNNKARAMFVIERKRDVQVARLDDRPPIRIMRLKSGERQEFITAVSLLYDIGAQGRYIIRAAIEVGKVRYESNPVILDVVRGIEINSVSKAVPGYPENFRNYSLRYHCRDKKEILFLCADENEGKTSYGVFPLGTLIRVAKPILSVDRSGNVTVVHQTNRDCFIRSKFESNQDGVFFIDQSYLGVDGKPYPFVREPPASSK